LIGERIGARLISHAGSLTNLSKYPASTVQILGAEKALFRALKTKGNTPKYGLIYHSSFIGKAGPRFKGRISRFLANKCSIASRIDCFSDEPSPKFGEALRGQVEERLNFFETGVPPSKNADTMRKVLDALALEDGSDVDDEMIDAPALTPQQSNKEKEEKKKKRKREAMDVDPEVDREASPSKKKKKEKGDKEHKKEKKEKKAAGLDVEGPVVEKKKPKEEKQEKKKKRKSEA